MAPTLSPLEVASGLVSGTSAPARRNESASFATPMDALEAAIRVALLRPPCIVSFSGGRDSSAVLAVAVRLARREGLALPVPATNRFPDVETADESEWQEQVITALGVEDWVRLDHDDELDCLGPIATRLLGKHGLLWPFNAHFLAPLIELARGGSVLTGLGGDELLGDSRWARAATVLAGRERPTLRDGRRIALAVAPRSLRRQVLRSRVEVDLPWLQPQARAAIHHSWIEDSAAEPLRWGSRVRWSAARRYLEVGSASLGLLGRDEDVEIAHPLVDRAFVETLAELQPAERFYDRTEAMRELFAPVLPDGVLARRSKSSFDGAFFNRHSRSFVESWDGSGIDEIFVDRDELTVAWQSPLPDARTFLLLQSAWLAQASPATASAAGRIQQPLGTVA